MESFAQVYNSYDNLADALFFDRKLARVISFTLWLLPYSGKLARVIYYSVAATLFNLSRERFARVIYITLWLLPYLTFQGKACSGNSYYSVAATLSN